MIVFYQTDTKFLTLPIENNINDKFYIVGAFFMSIGASGFFAGLLLDLKFNISSSLNIMSSVLHFIYNTIPLAIIYSILMYLISMKFTKGYKTLFSFFLQVIKFFVVGNIIIAISLLIAIDQLYIHNINIFEGSFNNMNNKNLFTLIIGFLIYFWAIYKFMFNPTHSYLANHYSWNKTLSIVLISSTVYLNSTLYALDFYPKLETKSLVDKQKFCKEVSTIFLDKNVECENIPYKEKSILEKECIKTIENSF